MLLDAGAVVEGTNALLRQLDFDDIDGLRLMLAYTRNVDDTSRDNEPALLHAIRRRRSAYRLSSSPASSCAARRARAFIVSQRVPPRR